MIKFLPPTTRISDDCAQTDWTTAQAVEIRAQVVEIRAQVVCFLYNDKNLFLSINANNKPNAARSHIFMLVVSKLKNEFFA